MRSDQGKEKITVESLLQLKRNEKPAEDFWEGFEQDFHRRRLNALLEQGSRPSFFLHPLFKAMAVALPALLLAGMAFLFNRTQEGDLNGRSLASASQPVSFDAGQAAVLEESAEPVQERDLLPEILSSRQMASQFVVDAIQSNPSTGMNFRKVLYTPAIRLNPASGASYVRDNLSTSDYRVTTADLKLGRNF